MTYSDGEDVEPSAGSTHEALVRATVALWRFTDEHPDAVTMIVEAMRTDRADLARDLNERTA